jgi:hypothetical protein
LMIYHKAAQKLSVIGAVLLLAHHVNLSIPDFKTDFGRLSEEQQHDVLGHLKACIGSEKVEQWKMAFSMDKLLGHNAVKIYPVREVFGVLRDAGKRKA